MISSKNIIFLTNLHLWSLDNGKGGKAFFHTMEAYIEDGWNIYLITTGGGVPQEVRKKINLIEGDTSKFDAKINSGNRLKSVIARFQKLSYLTRFFFTSASNLIKSHPSVNFVIYSYEVEAVKAGRLIANKYKFPLITRFQGTIISGITDKFINRIRYAPHFDALSTKADLIVMTNDGTQGLATLKRLKNSSLRIKFWRNGVDKNPVDENCREDLRRSLGVSNDFVFICVSRLVNWKRVHLAIESFAKFIVTHPLSRLVILGDGPEKNFLEKLCQDLNVDNKVVFCGAVHQNKVSAYLASADVFLSFYDLSNLGNPIMEAMRMGKPIITVDVGETKELITDGVNGILIPSDKLQTIADRMAEIKTNKMLFEKLSKGALHTAETQFWSWKERMLAELKESNELLKENP